MNSRTEANRAVERRADGRCEYCRMHQSLLRSVSTLTLAITRKHRRPASRFSVEHAVAKLANSR
jgi:hypothetical protein